MLAVLPSVVSVKSLPPFRRSSAPSATLRDTSPKLLSPKQSEERAPYGKKCFIKSTQKNPMQKLEDLYQIVLFNDDGVGAEHVVDCLMKVFKHDMAMACKIMMDAHANGRSVAEVEGEEAAKKHAEQLGSAQLTVAVEKI